MKSTVCALLLSSVTAKRMGPFPTSCIGQEDGYQWLKLTTSGHIHDDYTMVYQKCDQEYLIIDPHEDPNVLEYVTDSDDVVSWEQWWTPNVEWAESTWTGDEDDYFYYAISPDCNSCDLESGHQTAYFVFTSFDCKHSARGMALFSALTRDGVKPAIGNDGTHCVCVKPADSYKAKLLDETSFHYDSAVEEHDEWIENRVEHEEWQGKFHWNAAYTNCDDVEIEEVMAVETVTSSSAGRSTVNYTAPLFLSAIAVVVAVLAIGVWCIVGAKKQRKEAAGYDSVDTASEAVYVPYH